MAQTKLVSTDITSVPASSMPAFTGTTTGGSVPSSSGGTTNFLRADGAWAAPASGGSSTWGAITGTLSAQTDLQTALNGKQASGSYLTSNQTITVSGDATAAGATSLSLVLATVNANVGTWNNVTVNAKGLVTAGSNVAYLTSITSGQVTTALGFIPYNATNPSGFISANQTITASGDATGSGTTGLALTLASVGTAGTYTSVTTDAKGRVTAGTNPAKVNTFNTRTGAVTLTSADVTTALTFTPYNATNPSGYLTSSGAVTSAGAGTGISVSGATGAVTISAVTDASVVNGRTVQRITSNYTNATVSATSAFPGITTVANGVYLVEVNATTQCSSTGGNKWSIVAPAGATVEGWSYGTTSAITTLSYQRFTAINTLTTTANNTVATTPAPYTAVAVVTCGATTGTLTLGGAVVTAAQTNTVFSGSSIRISRIA
jgi:hypothetical protein